MTFLVVLHLSFYSYTPAFHFFIIHHYKNRLSSLHILVHHYTAHFGHHFTLEQALLFLYPRITLCV